MIRIYKIATIIVLIYSTLLLLLGGYLSIFGQFSQDSFLQYVFAEFVDTNIWQVNWYFFDYLYISSGLLGIFLGWSIWKNKAEAKRLWLLFITWQASISLIQIGPYRIGEPDKYSIAIICTLLVISWFTYGKQTIGAFSIFSKKKLLEIAACFVVLSQLTGIVLINSLKDSHQSTRQLSEMEMEQLVEDSLSKGMQEKMWRDTYGKEYKKYLEFYDQYEQKNGNNLKEIGIYLLRNGYSKDKFILMAVGTERYSAGDLSKAINYLSRALEGEYCSEMAKPSSELMIHFENAQIHYMLSVLYREQGDSEKANEEYVKSRKLFKKVKQEPLSRDLMAKWENMSGMVLNHFKRELQPEPSPNHANSADAKSRAAD